MSTKTSFKRIAAVAAVALTLGGLSAVSANAASLQKITLGSIAGTQTTTGTIGVDTTSLVNFNGYCDASGPYANTNYMVVYTALPATSHATLPTLSSLAYNDNSAGQLSSWYAPASSGIADGQILNDGNNTVVGGANWAHVSCGGTGRFNVYANVTFRPDVAGTYSLMLQDPTASYTQTTWTVTVAAKGAITAAASTLTPTSTTLTGPKAQGAAAGAIAIVAKNAADNADNALLSATVSGPGLVSFGNSFAAAGRAVSNGSLANSATLYVWGDGNAGTGTVTISSGSTVLGTQAVIFYGAPATISVAVHKTVVGQSGLPVNVIQVSEKDSLGFAIPSAGFGTLSLTSDATGSIASSIGSADTTTTTDGCSVTVVCYALSTGATVGTANLTVKDTTGTTVITAAPVAVRVSDSTPTAVAFTTDASDYAAGAQGTLTITVTNAAGIVPAGTYTVLSGGAASSLALVTGTLPSGDTVTVGNAGTATIKFNAPLSDGSVTISGTGATNVTVTPATFSVTSTPSTAAQAAIDAAQEATDAANAAYDAANNAMDSADAATAAAQDASDNASAALAAVTSLSATVAKLVSSVTAIATALASIKKKLGVK